MLRAWVSFENRLPSVKLCLSTAATQPLGSSAPPGPRKPAAAGWMSRIRLTGSLWCVGSQAAALLCCIRNVWSMSAAGVGQGLVEQVSCRAYSIWQACTSGLPGKSYVCPCSWLSVAGNLGVCRFISILQLCGAVESLTQEGLHL